MIFKPTIWVILIEAQAFWGCGKGIEIFTTKLITLQNKLALCANGAYGNAIY